MKSLILADIRRILHKKSFLIICTLVVLYAVGLTVWDKKHLFNGLLYAVHQKGVLSTVVLFIGIALFMGVYIDEVHSGALKAVIGKGIARVKVIAAKIIVCLIVTAIVYLFFLVLLLLLGLVSGAHMQADDVKILVLSVLNGAYLVVCTAPFAAIVFYLTDNGPFAVFFDVLLLTVIPLVMTLLNGLIIFRNLHIADYYINGFANRAFTDMLLTGSGLGTYLAGALIYIGLAFLISFLIYRKKELDL